MLFASLPPAALNYLLAERYQQEPERVASLVLIAMPSPSCSCRWV